MRISDWSSDVCSSDLGWRAPEAWSSGGRRLWCGEEGRADEVEQVLGGDAFVACGDDELVREALGAARWPGGCGDDGADPTSGGDLAGRLELPVGACDGSGGDAQIGGERANGGKAVSLVQRSGGDEGDDLGADLLVL